MVRKGYLRIRFGSVGIVEGVVDPVLGQFKCFLWRRCDSKDGENGLKGKERVTLGDRHPSRYLAWYLPWKIQRVPSWRTCASWCSVCEGEQNSEGDWCVGKEVWVEGSVLEV